MRLIDADALKKAICRDQCERDGCGYHCSEIAYVDDAPTVGGWVSVKDRLPEDETIVIIIVKYEVGWYRAFAWHDAYGWHSSAEEFNVEDSDYVTHWMSLPELPEEVTRDAD